MDGSDVTSSEKSDMDFFDVFHQNNTIYYQILKYAYWDHWNKCITYGRYMHTVAYITGKCRISYNYLFELLLKNREDVNIDGKKMNALLRFACRVKDIKSVRMLIKNGVDIDMHVPGDIPALMWAIVSRKTEIVTILLNHGCDVNIQTFIGTPLIISCIHRDLDSMKAILDHGCDVHLKNELNKTALQIAMNYITREVLYSSIHTSTCTNIWIQITIILLEHGANVMEMHTRASDINMLRFIQIVQSSFLKDLLYYGLDVVIRKYLYGLNKEKLKDAEKKDIVVNLTELSLLNLTRIKIREHIVETYKTTRLPQQIDKLNLPSYITRYLKDIWI